MSKVWIENFTSTEIISIEPALWITAKLHKKLDNRIDDPCCSRRALISINIAYVITKTRVLSSRRVQVYLVGLTSVCALEWQAELNQEIINKENQQTGTRIRDSSPRVEGQTNRPVVKTCVVPYRSLIEQERGRNAVTTKPADSRCCWVTSVGAWVPIAQT